MFASFEHGDYIPFDELPPKPVRHDEAEGLTRGFMAGTRLFPQNGVLSWVESLSFTLADL